MPGTPDPVFEEHLAALRERLKRARDERGGCPPWDELRADLLPGGRNRPGRDERIAHREACPYCDVRVREWEKTFEHTADALEAVERGVLRGLAGGAMSLARRLTQPRAAVKPAARDVAPAPSAPAPPTPTYLATPMSQAPRARPTAEPAPAPAHGAARILVVEMADRRSPPELVFLCAAVLEAEVAIVDRVDELAGDPDLALVCGIVLGGLRPVEEWPTAVRSARGLAPGRPVVLLAAFGANPSAGARRALGEALVGEDEPAERLLLALDPTLR